MVPFRCQMAARPTQEMKTDQAGCKHSESTPVCVPHYPCRKKEPQPDTPRFIVVSSNEMEPNKQLQGCSGCRILPDLNVYLKIDFLLLYLCAPLECSAHRKQTRVSDPLDLGLW